MQKIPSGRFAHFRQFRPRTLHGLELISRLEAEAKERQNAPQRLERDEEGKLKPLPQLIGEEVDDKHVREATHHLARVFSTTGDRLGLIPNRSDITSVQKWRKHWILGELRVHREKENHLLN